MEQDVLSIWAFWAEAIDRPDAGELVSGINSAILALSRIQTHGFPQDEMEQWLQDWPTSYGMTHYQAARGVSGSVAAQVESAHETVR